MKVKQLMLKEDLSITFAPEEIWQLIVCCEGYKSYCKDAMEQYPKGSLGYLEYKQLYEEAEKMQQKIIEARNANGILEETEV